MKNKDFLKQNKKNKNLIFKNILNKVLIQII